MTGYCWFRGTKCNVPVPCLYQCERNTHPEKNVQPHGVYREDGKKVGDATFVFIAKRG